jgi:hypothetical protein
MQAAFLGALAVENALKALILARIAHLRAGSETPLTKLPKGITGHDLGDLARKAGLVTCDAGELQILEAGEHIIAGCGRYPTMTKAEETPSRISMNPQGAFDACERLCLRCVEEIAKTTHPRFAGARPLGEFVAEECKRFEQDSGGVSPPWGGEEHAALIEGYVMVPASKGS